MKVTILLTVLLVVFFAPVRLQAQATGYRSYISPAGYAFYVPSDWQPTTSVAGTEANFNSPDGNAFLFVNVDKSGTSTPLAFVQSVANAAPLLYQNPTQPVFGSANVAGALDSEGVALGGTNGTTGVYWGNAVVAASTSAGVFALTVGMTSDYYNAHPSQVDYIVSSFQLNPTTPSPVLTTPPPLPPPPVPPSSTSGSAAQSPIAAYSELTGAGDKAGAPFTSTTNILQICWNVYNLSPTFNFGTQATFYIYPVGSAAYAGEVNGSSDGAQCSYVYTPPGRYYIDVVATPWTNWFVGVGPAP